MHSLASDGNWRPSRVVTEAKKRGLESIALTDHDTIYGVSEAIEEGQRMGLKVVSGIEIDSSFNSDGLVLTSVEILGLGFNLPLLESFANQLAAQRLQSYFDIAERFNQYIVSGGFRQHNQNSKYPLVNPLCINAHAMVLWKCTWNGYFNPSPVFSNAELLFYIFDRFAPNINLIGRTLQGDKSLLEEVMREYHFIFGVHKNRPSSAQAIKEIKDAGGLAVLAHPGLSTLYLDGMLTREWEQEERQWFSVDNKSSPFALVKMLKQVGLDGVELYFYRGNDQVHGHMQDRINQYFKSLSEQLGLCITFGSDCHGPRGRKPYLGLFGSDKVII